MESEDLKEIRTLFEGAELESDPARKLSLLDDALNAFASFVADGGSDEREIETAKSLHDTYLRRIIRQVTSAKKIDQATCFGYANLIIKSDLHTREFISNDREMSNAISEFGDRYHGFIRG